MRAITQDVLGGPEMLKEAELERPEPGISQILIRVHAAGVNPYRVGSHAEYVTGPTRAFALKPAALDHVAVQIAKALGAYVIGTASAGNHDLLRGGLLITLQPLEPGIADQAAATGAGAWVMLAVSGTGTQAAPWSRPVAVAPSCTGRGRCARGTPFRSP
jgi:NADPH:quinone reductase-like Zn-dependent oxidoreductase